MSTEQYDVIVAGGGSAGVAAAVASARCGARTLLLERAYCLGGASTLRNVVTYCGLYTLGDRPRQVVGGIGAEVVATLKSRGAITPPLRHRGVFAVFDPESVKLVLDNLCSASGVDVQFGSAVVDAERRDGCITTISIADHGGLRSASASAFVDATGDGDLSAFAGASVRYGNPDGVNLATLGTRFGGIPKGVNVTAAQIAEAVAKLGNTADITKDRSVIARLPLSDDLVCYLASADYDPRDAASASIAEHNGRQQAWQYLEALCSIPGCQDAYLVSTGPEFGTRESRRINSTKQLTWQDIQQRREFDDCIALGAWGAEWHDRETFVSTFDYPPDKSSYQIPLACLTSADTDNLFVAGRLADGDRLAGAAIRVMGTAFALGHAAGVAAALSADCAPVNGRAVRQQLHSQQAILSHSASYAAE